VKIEFNALTAVQIYNDTPGWKLRHDLGRTN
jgi:hypothetical protein